MEIVKVPDKLEDWNLDILSKLMQLRDIESETFDFKGTDLRGIYKDICALANTRCGFLVLGVEENKANSTTLFDFRKIGFDKGKEDYVSRDITNNVVNIETTPKVNVKSIEEDDKFYVVLEVEHHIFKKPYFIKNQGQCYVRIGSTSTPASRLTVLDLFTNSIEILHNLENLRAATVLLKETLSKTRNHFGGIAADAASKATPIDLTLFRNAVLSCEPFLSENNLLGRQTQSNYQEGITSILHTLESLNVHIISFNNENRSDVKIELQKRVFLQSS